MSSTASSSRSPKRKRTAEDEQTAVSNVRKHPRFWFEDGNVVLVADDALSFRLHRGVLSLHSEVFRFMFAFPSRNEDNEMFEGCPVVRLQDSGPDLTLFFALLYDGGKDLFFRRDEDLEFRVARAMLILSFKYDVQHIREEALHRLRVWFPSTLADWDEFQDSQADENAIMAVLEPDNIAVINMARKFDLPDLLPIAFYNCSCMPLIELTRGADYGSGVEMLSQEDLGKVLAGVDQLDKLIEPRLAVFLNFSPWAGCQRNSLCRQGMRRLLRLLNKEYLVFTRKWTINSVDSEVEDAIRTCTMPNAVPALCSLCKSALFEKCEEQRVKAWNQLGEIYGVKPWPIEDSDEE